MYLTITILVAGIIIAGIAAVLGKPDERSDNFWIVAFFGFLVMLCSGLVVVLVTYLDPGHEVVQTRNALAPIDEAYVFTAFDSGRPAFLFVEVIDGTPQWRTSRADETRFTECSVETAARITYRYETGLWFHWPTYYAFSDLCVPAGTIRVK